MLEAQFHKENTMTETCPHHSGIVAQFNAICTKLELIEKSIEKQLLLHEKQVEVTAKDLERRLEAMNEIRSQLNRQADTFITKIEVNLLFEKLDLNTTTMARNNRERIDLLEKMYAEGRGGKKWEDHIITVLIGLAVLVTIWIMQHGIK